jgi:hypothetical protein
LQTSKWSTACPLNVLVEYRLRGLSDKDYLTPRKMYIDYSILQIHKGSVGKTDSYADDSVSIAMQIIFVL